LYSNTSILIGTVFPSFISVLARYQAYFGDILILLRIPSEFPTKAYRSSGDKSKE
jgi:hypothetical protein